MSRTATTIQTMIRTAEPLSLVCMSIRYLPSGPRSLASPVPGLPKAVGFQPPGVMASTCSRSGAILDRNPRLVARPDVLGARTDHTVVRVLLSNVRRPARHPGERE